MINLEKENIKIKLDKTRVEIHIAKSSDLSTTYCIIKNLLWKTDCIPEAIYLIKKNLKIRESISEFRYIKFWNFIDRKMIEDEITLTFNSEDHSWKNITGWEVRFEIEPSIKEIETLLKKSQREGRDFAEKLKKEEW